MPRPRSTATSAVDQLDTDQTLSGLEDLPQDPAPRAARVRAPRKRGPAKATGTRGKITHGAGGRMMSKQQKIDKVSAEVYMYLGLFVGGWEMRDPCAEIMWESVAVPTPGGPAEIERLAGVSARLVAMIARNDKLLDMAASSGIVGELAMLGHLMFPVAKLVWQHHGPTGTGHGRRPEMSEDELGRTYPAYAG